MDTLTVQTASWHLVHALEPGIWWVKAAFCFVCFLSMFFRIWSVPITMRVACYFSMTGMVLIWLAPLGNNAFGPLGDLIFWPSYAIYRIYDVIRRWPAVRAKMAMQPLSPERVLFKYITTGRVPEVVLHHHYRSEPRRMV